MGKINWGRVVLGGLVAGVVLNVFDYVLYGVLLADDFKAALQALGKPAMSGSLTAWFVFLDFVYGIFAVFLYAAMRPRFGAGPKTAIIAGLAIWFLAFLLHGAGEMPLGLFPNRLYVIPIIVGIVELPLATATGGKVYQEAA